jgi:L-iditol 2-dehydrogenase
MRESLQTPASPAAIETFGKHVHGGESMVKINEMTRSVPQNLLMKKEFLALRLHKAGDLRLHQAAAAEPRDNEVAIRVEAVGICGSDLHWFLEGGIGDAQLTRPLVLGHELAGEILTGERKGERVAIDPAIPCGHCRYCQQGNPNLCPLVKFAGHGEQDGGLQHQISWPAEQLFTLPDSISMIEGALLEPLGVAIHALDLAKIEIGMRAGVIGCGPIGLMLTQLLRLRGASQVIAVEKLPHRLEAAGRYGATHSLSAEEGAEAEEILAITQGEGLDVCIEAAGDNQAIETAVETARPGARVVLVGIPTVDQTIFRASTARRKGLTIKLCRRMKFTYPRAIQFVESGQIDVASLVTHKYALQDFRQAIETATQRHGLKVVIEP